jgi:acyl-CoA reductase-like NAD-dependent aldehyde dehydrogenase
MLFSSATGHQLCSTAGGTLTHVWCYYDYTQVAVNRIIGAKWSTCSGQACIAIDYVLVEEEFAPILVCFSFLR